MSKIILSENDQKKVEVFKGGFSKMSESFKANKKTWIIIVCAVALIIGAVWLNVALFADNSTDTDYDPANSTGTLTTSGGENVTAPQSEDSYFTMAQLNRTQAYDSAYESLLAVTTSTTATSEAKNSAFEQISVMADNKQLEAKVETLVKAKGFKECIAVITGDKIDVIVMSEDLLANEVAQIQEIVFNQTGITPENVRIVKRTN